MAQAIMVLGTASDVGKSVIAAALCRLLHRRGIRVAPFKAQNMSLNSFVTVEGGEMGRAQVVQAQACGLQPHVDMNPILLKPEADNCSQVIVHGKVWGKHDARNYFARHDELFPFVQESYARLASAYDVIVIEGAGSAAEINLRDKDLVNWPVAHMADAEVFLVADIDRGGVFAQVIGTLDLLRPEERRRVQGIVINKFRGDASLFADGVSFIESRTKLPVLGVVPFMRELELDQEDAVTLDQRRHVDFAPDKVNIAVVLLPHMSNFSDFAALVAEPDVNLRYAAAPEKLAGADAVILPGSKSTVADLDYLDEKSFRASLAAHVAAGGELIGLCGGLQLLGRNIRDPFHVESGGTRTGFAFLDIDTELTDHKTTVQVEAIPLWLNAGDAGAVQGYEIHMGQTTLGAVAPSFSIFSESENLLATPRLDGAIDREQLIWGTYIHGVFDRPAFRRQWLNRLRQRKSLAPLALAESQSVNRRMASAIDNWADHFEQNINLQLVLDCLGRQNGGKINL
jgi:adenosylcobyric acid synthase